MDPLDPPRGEDAIVFKYVAPRTLVSVVIPICMVHLYVEDGWLVLEREDDVRRATRCHDWFLTYLSEVVKWRRGEPT